MVISENLTTTWSVASANVVMILVYVVSVSRAVW